MVGDAIRADDPSADPEDVPRLVDADPPGLPPVTTMREACAAGMTPDEVRQRVRSGRWQRVCRGVYDRRVTASAANAAARAEVSSAVSSAGRAEARLPGGSAGSSRLGPPLDPPPRARGSLSNGSLLHSHGRPIWTGADIERIRAVARLHPRAVVSHESAAVLHGLPVLGRTNAVTFTEPATSNGQARSGVAISRAHLDDAEIVMLDGLAVTTMQRTCLDLARHRGLAAGLAAGDAALRTRFLTQASAREAAHALPPGARGRRIAIQVAEHVDARRESPLESWSWARFLQWRLPLPSMQVQIVDELGFAFAFVDYLWEACRLVGECDGALKYETKADLLREKRREDRIRECGYGVVRWEWVDVARGTALRARLRRLLNS